MPMLEDLRAQAEATLRDVGYRQPVQGSRLWIRDWPECFVFDLEAWLAEAEAARGAPRSAVPMIRRAL